MVSKRLETSLTGEEEDIIIDTACCYGRSLFALFFCKGKDFVKVE